MLPHPHREIAHSGWHSTLNVVVSVLTGMAITLSACGSAPSVKLLPTATPAPHFSTFLPETQISSILDIHVDDVGFPGALAAGPDDAVWFCMDSQPRGANHFVGPDHIVRMTSNGTVTNVWTLPGADSATLHASCVDLTSGPDGNLWVTLATSTLNEQNCPPPGSSMIARVKPDGTITKFALPAYFTFGGCESLPTDIVAGADGNLWFTVASRIGNLGGDAIGRISLSGTFSIFPLPGNTVEFPLPGNTVEAAILTAGPDGNLWFSAYDRIGRISPTGAIKYFALPHAGQCSADGGITAGSDGNLWFVDRQVASDSDLTCNIGRITPTGSISESWIPGANSLSEVAAGANDTLCFSEPTGLAFVTTSETLTSVPFSERMFIPTPFAFISGPDHAIWFANHAINSIVRYGS